MTTAISRHDGRVEHRTQQLGAQRLALLQVVGQACSSTMPRARRFASPAATTAQKTSSNSRGARAQRAGEAACRR
jgi:hypothetical protein